MARKRLTERQALEVAIQQGAVIPCFRCRTPFTAETIRTAEREHIHEIALGGPDTVANCAFSCRACHSIVTNGTAATSVGSSKQRTAKTRRLEAAAKIDQAVRLGLAERPASTLRSRSTFPKRLHVWPPRGSCPLNRKRRA